MDWFLNFGADMSQAPPGKSKLPFINVPTVSSVWNYGNVENIESLTDQQIADMGFMTRPQIAQMAAASPGSYWYIFGEANRHSFMTGQRFAHVFRYFAEEIKQADPTAKIVSTSLLNWNFTCVGCAGYTRGDVWLQAFMSEYLSINNGEPPPVDVWAIDTYPIDWTNTPNGGQHVSIVADQLVGFRQYLSGFPEYANTPIWITEIAVHVGYDGWTIEPGTSKLLPVGAYRWASMSDYLVGVLDWLEANAATYNIEKWFFFTSWRDIVNVESDGYMGIIFFEGPQAGASLNCLGQIYRNRATGGPRLVCDASGNAVPE
ncbi:MAG: glycosyl hydrolase [Chloroflexi bacterium]|nr:glycosyl hydrolase [Chloroflexota bacterium]